MQFRKTLPREYGVANWSSGNRKESFGAAAKRLTGSALGSMRGAASKAGSFMKTSRVYQAYGRLPKVARYGLPVTLATGGVAGAGMILGRMTKNPGRK